MNSRNAILIPLLAAGALNACCTSGVKPIALGNGCFVLQQRCTPSIKQTEWGFSVHGVEFGAGKQVGRIELGTTVKQNLTAVAQILDQVQVIRCRELNQLTTCDESRVAMLKLHSLATSRLSDLALIAQMHSDDPAAMEKAINEWLIRTGETLSKAHSAIPLGAGSRVDFSPAFAARTESMKALGIEAGSAEYRRIIEEPALRTD